MVRIQSGVPPPSFSFCTYPFAAQSFVFWIGDYNYVDRFHMPANKRDKGGCNPVAHPPLFLLKFDTRPRYRYRVYGAVCLYHSNVRRKPSSISTCGR